MTDSSTFESLVKGFYTARVKGDIDTIRKTFANNATFQIAGSKDASPMPVIVQGANQIVSLMQGMIGTFALTEFTYLSFLVDGDNAAVRWRATCHHIGTDQVFTTEFGDFIESANGQITSFVEFLDTALAVKVLGAN